MKSQSKRSHGDFIEFPQRRRWNLFIRKKGYEYAEVVNLPNEAKSILSLRIHVHLRYFSRPELSSSNGITFSTHVHKINYSNPI